MTTLYPRGYGGLTTYQFSSPNQHTNRYYNDRYYNDRFYTDRYSRHGTYFPPPYPTQPLYQPPLHPYDTYPTMSFNQSRKPRLDQKIESFFNNLDNQYRQEQYNRKLHKLEKQYAKLQGDYTPAAPYAGTTDYFGTNSGVVYQYEKETKFVPFPVLVNAQGQIVGGSGNLGSDNPWNTSFSGGSNIPYGMGGGMSLPPKIRVIFIPTGQSSLQQPYTGPLTMPPFLYNRISQPLCSFPLPPPLPQIGSLPLTPAVQQMVVQRYSNPIAVLPFSPNWQMPQMAMSAFSQVSSYQQQAMIPMASFQPVSAAPSMPVLPSFLSAPQYFSPPSAPILSLPALPAAPQSYIPYSTPALSFPALPPSSQSYIPSSALAVSFSAFQPAPQSYIPPSAPALSLPALPPAPQSQLPSAQYYFPSSTVQASMNVPSPPSYEQQSQNTHNIQTTSQYFNGGYPSICRACPPAPPPLNIPVTGHCWVQHCSACHHVPTPITNPNARPSGGRITPLLRHPTVPQYVPEQTMEQQQQYYQSTAPVLMRPWLRKTPPLPPGAILISDEYIDKKDTFKYDHPQRPSRRHKRSSHYKYRSTTVTSKSTTNPSPTVIKDSRSVSPRRTNKSNDSLNQRQGPVKSNSMISKTSSDTSSSGLSFEYRKVTILSSKNGEKKVLPQQLAGEARNINLKYNYQPQELPSVYLLNRYLNSSSEASTSSPNPSRVSDCSPSLIKEHSQTSLMSSNVDLVKEKSISENEDEKFARPLSQLKHTKERVLIIRELMSSSPSTMSTVSSNMEFCVITQEKDSISTNNPLKLAKVEEHEVLEQSEF